MFFWGTCDNLIYYCVLFWKNTVVNTDTLLLTSECLILMLFVLWFFFPDSNFVQFSLYLYNSTSWFIFLSLSLLIFSSHWANYRPIYLFLLLSLLLLVLRLLLLTILICVLDEVAKWKIPHTAENATRHPLLFGFKT